MKIIHITTIMNIKLKNDANTRLPFRRISTRFLGRFHIKITMINQPVVCFKWIQSIQSIRFGLKDLEQDELHNVHPTNCQHWHPGRHLLGPIFQPFLIVFNRCKSCKNVLGAPLVVHQRILLLKVAGLFGFDANTQPPPPSPALPRRPPAAKAIR